MLKNFACHLLQDADQQYQSLKTFEKRKKSSSVHDEKDHPESHDGPYSIIESNVNEVSSCMQ